MLVKNRGPILVKNGVKNGISAACEGSSAIMEQAGVTRPSIAIAAGVCILLAIGILATQFGGSHSQPADAPPQQTASRGVPPSAGQRNPAAAHGGWMAQENEPPSDSVATSRPNARLGTAGSRAAGAAGAEGGTGPAATGSVANRGRGAAQVRPGAESSVKASETPAAGTSSTTGSEPIQVNPSLVGQPTAARGANPLAGTGNASAAGSNPAAGGPVRPAGPQSGAARVNPEQGVTIFTGFDSCQGQPTCNAFPTDSRIDIADARNVIAGEAGAVSFWLEPQWDAKDTSRATLVNLGSGDTQQNRFEIFKDGQSLHLAFADNRGVPSDLSAVIDGWQPGERHLVTATWGQGQVSFYVDGNPAGQQSYSGQLDLAKDTRLSIGSGYPDSQTVPGVFLDTHFYKRALGPQEVATQAAAVPAAGRLGR
jgi:hypothetical protein